MRAVGNARTPLTLTLSLCPGIVLISMWSVAVDPLVYKSPVGDQVVRTIKGPWTFGEGKKSPTPPSPPFTALKTQF